ncbi:MAG: transketolase family protein [Blautia sp.]|jgi:transketolase
MWTLAENFDGEMEMRTVFRETLEALMDEHDNIMALEADLGTASGFIKIKKSHPENFLEMGISEANMAGVAAGLSMAGYVPFIHSFSPFVSRRIADQIFLEGAYAKNTVNIYGSDPGVCAAANGGTHTTFEDIAFYRAIPEAMVFDPADGVQLKWLIEALIEEKGVHYIRANRKDVPTIYREGSSFEIGKGNVIRPGEDVLLISMGILLKDALDAAEMLEKEGISTEVVDMFTVKPLDKELVLREMKGKRAVVTFENHSIYGGLGSAVAEVMAGSGAGVPLKILGVNDRFGQVGSLEFLKEDYGLTAGHAASAVLKMLR